MKKTVFPLRVALVIISAILISVIAILIMPDYLKQDWRRIFIDITLILVFISFALPFLFHPIRKDGGVFITGAVYYTGQLIFILISIALIVLAILGLMTRNLAYALELTALLIFVIYLFASVRVYLQRGFVRQKESSKTNILSELKVQCNSLNSKISFATIQEKYRQQLADFCTDLRYLSPTDDLKAAELEQEMLSIIRYINDSEALSKKVEDSSDILGSQLQRLTALMNQRKTIYQE